MTTLNEAELDTLAAKENAAKASAIGYWEIYSWLADTLQAKGVPVTNSALLWLRGATEANANRGAMSQLIRTYTETESQLRYKTSAEPKIQAASDAVAQNLIDDLLGRNAPAWARGTVPDITRIAEADATAVGRTLFNVSEDTSAPPTNSAWSGAVLFSLLRSDQTGRLIGTGNSSSLDTLNDLRDVLYSFVAYAKGLADARNTFLVNQLAAVGGNVEAARQLAIDTQILGPTFFAYT